ncbi:hypothetical protein [Solibacillus sp.]|uniref:hypothetical protein n=1 Tax=Solibacillus sp. TaxID=1909654 RepID=UPI00331575CF
MNLKQEVSTNFQSLKTSISAKPIKSTNKLKPISNETLAKLIIISADVELVKNDGVGTTDYKNFSSKITDTYVDLPDRTNGLQQAITRVLKNDMKNIRCSNVQLEQLKIWLRLLERYTDNEQLLQKAQQALSFDLKISFITFNEALAALKTLIQKHEKLEAVSMTTTNEKANMDLNVALVSNDYLHETITFQTKEVVKSYLNLHEMDELIPNFAFIKGDVITLNAVYEDGDYVTDIAMSFFLTSIHNDFDKVVAIITDFDESRDEYDTLLHLISPMQLIKFVQDIFNEKDISFFEVENINDLLKLVAVM